MGKILTPGFLKDALLDNDLPKQRGKNVQMHQKGLSTEHCTGSTLHVQRGSFRSAAGMRPPRLGHIVRLQVDI